MLQKQLNRFSGGMDWDTTPQLVPTDRYEFALNAIVSDKIGDKGGLIFENSNQSSASMPNGFTVIGNVKSTINERESYILFSSADNTKVGEIGIYYPQDNKYERIVRSACLNFHSNHPVNAVIKIKSDNTRVIYFTDKVNPYRSFNIDKINDYLDVNSELICDRILFAPITNVPTITATEVTEGGSLKLGQYRFYIRYVTKDKTTTNIVANSEAVNIYRNNGFGTIEGGYNLGDSNYADQSYPATAKSIKLTQSNLDTDFTAYQIIVVSYTSGTGAVTSTTVSAEIPISQTTWTYTGSNTTATVATDEIIVDKYNAYIVGAHTEKDNRLWIGNLIESNPLEFAAIQMAANNIKVRWKAKRIPKFDINQKGNGLNPISHKTFMRDEVYALGIIGTDKRGNKTPVFHIPGRAAQAVATGKIDQNEVFITRRNFTGNWDKQLLDTTGIDVMPHEVEHLSQYNATNQIERWRIYNTAWIDTLNANEFAGELAYYENNVLYPDIDTPSGKLYGALTGTPIRHHKMPDSNTVPHVSNTELRPLTLDVDLTSFLSALPTTITNEIQKWEIVVGNRIEDNKTVLDKGITTFNECNRMYLKNELTVQFNTVNFYSPKSLFGQKSLNGTHYKTEWYNSYWDLRNDSTLKHFESGPAGSATKGRVMMTFTDWIGKTNTDIPFDNSRYKSNFKINGYQYLQPATVKNFQESFTQGTFAGNTTYTNRNHHYDTAALKYNLNNDFLVNPINGSGVNTPYRGYVSYGAIKSEKSVYESLPFIGYNIFKQSSNIANTVITLNEGDSFITPTTFVISDLVEETSSKKLIWHEIHHFWAESDTNAGLRHETNVYNRLDNQLYYTGWSQTDGTTRVDTPNNFFSDYLNRSIGIDTGLWLSDIMEGNSFKQAYLYNADYNNKNSLKNYTQLSDSYDYFSVNQAENRNKEYYRYRYSEKDFDDETTDSYRNIKVNNTGTIPAESGEIRDMFVDKNKLFIRTNRSLLHLPTNQQTLKTNDGTVYLGTGEVAPYPAQPISAVDWSYGGGYNFQHRLVTEFGTVLIDIYSRKVFLLRDGLQDITPSMESFWQQYGKWDLLDKGVDYFPNHLTVTYDTYEKRFLITQKHWKFKPDKLSEYLYSVIAYDELTNLFTITQNDTNIVTTKTPNEILDLEEWTISYSFLNNAWISFHSYKHDWQFASERGFIGFEDGFLWKHYIDDEQTFLSGRFNNNLYPMQIEWTVNQPPQAEKYLEHISIESLNNKWDTTYAYSKNQHTGILPIEVHEESGNSMLSRILNTVNLSSKENYFRIDNYKDKTIDISQPVFSNTERWNKQINAANLTNQVLMYEGKIKGKWIKAGLTYMPSILKRDRQAVWAVESAFKIVQR